MNFKEKFWYVMSVIFMPWCVIILTALIFFWISAPPVFFVGYLVHEYEIFKQLWTFIVSCVFMFINITLLSWYIHYNW